MNAGVTFHSSEQQLTTLLSGVHSGKIQLPDFQRDWVWDDERIRGLLASVSMSYPVGTPCCSTPETKTSGSPRGRSRV